MNFVALTGAVISEVKIINLSSGAPFVDSHSKLMVARLTALFQAC